MNKISFIEKEQLEKLQTQQGLSLIFKHSTRCSISRMALKRVESDEQLSENPVDYYYLDLLKHRDLSNEIAKAFSVEHQSPQVLIIQNGKCVYSATHSAIQAEEILEHLNAK